MASTQDNSQPSPSLNSTNMVSIADHTFHMLSRHLSNDNEEADFPLYPDPSQNMFGSQFPFDSAQGFNMDHNASMYPRTQESYPTSTGYHSTTMYAEAPHYPHESPEIRGAPSNYSASGPSATSSAMGSPHSIHGHIVPVPEWTPHGLGLNPSIVSYDNFSNGNEFTFGTSGMDDFALDLNPAKPNGFVGECKNVSRSASRQHGSISSNPESLSSLSTFVPSPRTVDMSTSPATSRSMASPSTPVSAVRRDSRDDFFKSPSVSAYSGSPLSSRRPSQAFNAPLPAVSSAAGRTHSPTSAVSQSFTSESIPSYTTYHQSPFFSQSSGNFVPPLESSCRFPLSIHHHFSSCNQGYKKNLLTNCSSDPSILHPFSGRPGSAAQSNEASAYQPPTYPASPALSHISRSPRPVKQDSQSPYLGAQYSTYPYPPPRRPSLASHQSYSSQDGNFSSEESKEKGRCQYPECGKVFKDLKAHMLTHQNERPEKCPIQTCDYHIKGFARKVCRFTKSLPKFKRY